MKTSIIYLGIAMLVLTSTQAKSNFTSKGVASENVNLQNDQNDLALNTVAGDTKTFAPIEDKVILNPETALNMNYQSSIEAMIIENNKIIESNISEETSTLNVDQPTEDMIQENNQIIESQNTNVVYPLYLDRTIEDIIAEDNAIIESNINTQAQPLDFDTINKKAFTLKQNTNKLVGMN